MDTSNTKDESSCKVTDISIEEFWRTEILGSNKSVNDADLIANSNQNLCYLTVHREFTRFSDYINRPLYSLDFGDLLTPTFRTLYLLLLSNKGKSEALKFYARFYYLFPTIFEDLLQCETCEDAQNLLQSQPRITVELSKRAYRCLLNWIKRFSPAGSSSQGNFTEKSEMINILRVLHENFHFDIQNDKESFFIDEKHIMEEIQSWVPIKPKKNSEHQTKDAAKASSENKVQVDETQADQKKSEPKAGNTSVIDIQVDETQGDRKEFESDGFPSIESLIKSGIIPMPVDSSLFVLKDKARIYLEKVKNSGLSMEKMIDAVLSPPSDEDWDDYDDEMDCSEGGSVFSRMHQ
ncbi:hypothetical protein HNY73_014588 [Argiope bruennichi]|uniref:Uncharacterized protein n=2 Tax=Argiope bruennichi TaxID=94029 RepID=A0A8T0EQY9_ARGBR|nr:hypothetical protein HNY73_014588 [Argiope bruennichi]